jgi:hypothetical protein
LVGSFVVVEGDDAMKNISTNSITRKVFDELKEKERVEAEAIEKNPELKEKKEREKEYMITKPSGFVATDSSASFTSSSFNSASKKLSQLMIAKVFEFLPAHCDCHITNKQALQFFYCYRKQKRRATSAL